VDHQALIHRGQGLAEQFETSWGFNCASTRESHSCQNDGRHGLSPRWRIDDVQRSHHTTRNCSDVANSRAVKLWNSSPSGSKIDWIWFESCTWEKVYTPQKGQATVKPTLDSLSQPQPHHRHHHHPCLSSSVGSDMIQPRLGTSDKERCRSCARYNSCNPIYLFCIAWSSAHSFAPFVTISSSNFDFIHCCWFRSLFHSLSSDHRLSHLRYNITSFLDLILQGLFSHSRYMDLGFMI